MSYPVDLKGVKQRGFQTDILVTKISFQINFLKEEITKN